MVSITFAVEDENWFKERNKSIEDVRKEIDNLVNDYLDKL